MMKRKGLKAVGLMSLMALFVTVLAACSQAYKPGNEVGKYYFDHNGEEYNITLKDDGNVEFKVGDDNLTGSYRLDGDKLTIKLSNKEELVITYNNEEMSFTYDDVDMSFIRAVDYKVVFNSNGGSKVSDVTVRNGRRLAEPKSPTRTQYSFVGWYKDEALKNPFNFAEEEITSDITLYAKWSYVDIVNTITYKNDDIVKTTNPSKDVVENKPFILEVPVLTNDYLFDGWYTEAGKRLTDKTGKSLEPWSPELGNIEITAKYVTPLSFTELEDGNLMVSGSEKTRDLEEIVIPSSFDGRSVVEIGEFKDHRKLTSVTLPKTMERFSEVAFISSPVLAEYKLEEGNKLFSVSDGVLFTDNGATLVAYPVAKPGKSYTVPNNVTKIANRAFSGVMIRNKMDIREYFGELESVTLPANIIEIGEYAFYERATLTTVEFAGKGSLDLTIGAYAFSVVPLKSFTIPENTKVIGEGAFASDLIHEDRMPSFNENLVLPEGLKEIGANAFMVNRNIKTVKLPSTLEKLGEGAFNGCAMLTSVEFAEGIKLTSIPDAAFLGDYELNTLVLPKGIKEIGSQAFENTAFTEVVIPEGVTVVGNRAFAECSSLTAITFPASLDKLGKDVFTKCESLGADGLVFGNDKLAKIVDGVVYNADMTELILYPRNNPATEYVMPDTVTAIPDGAFREIAALESITLSKNLKEIPAWAFYNMKGLSSIVIPASVEAIGDNAFRSSKCTTITFAEGSKLKSIGKESFNGAKVSKLVFPEGFTTIGIDAFKSTLPGGLTEIVLPSTVTTIPEGAFENNTKLKSFTVAEGNPYFKSVDGVLYNADLSTIIAYPAAKAGTEYTLPKETTRIAASAFYSVKLTKILGAEGLATVGDKAFYKATKLESIDLSKVTEIGNRAFYRAEALANIDIRNAEFIDAEAFYQCYELTSIELGSKLTSLPKGVFQKSGLTEIVVPGNIKTIGEYAFSGTNAVSVVLEEGVIDILDNAFSASNVLASVTLPNSLKYIGDHVFDNSAFKTAALKTITIGANVEHIGEGVFTFNVLEEIKVDPQNRFYKSVDGDLYTADGKTLIASAEGKKLA